MTTELDLELRDGWIEAELAEEFPELRLVHAALAARPGARRASSRSACAGSPTATRARR